MYAAEDAIVGIRILLAQLKNLWTPALEERWETSMCKALEEVCEPFVEVEFNDEKMSEYMHGNVLYMIFSLEIVYVVYFFYHHYQDFASFVEIMKFLHGRMSFLKNIKSTFPQFLFLMAIAFRFYFATSVKRVTKSMKII